VTNFIDRASVLFAIICVFALIGNVSADPPACDNECRMRLEHYDTSAAAAVRCTIFDLPDCYYCKRADGVCVQLSTDPIVEKPRCSADEENQRSNINSSCQPNCNIGPPSAVRWVEAWDGIGIFIEGQPRFFNFICKTNAPPPGADPKGTTTTTTPPPP
jgi:hypothetical protein